MAANRGQRLGWDGYSAGWSSLHLGVDPRRSTPFVQAWLRLAYVTGRGLAALRVPPGSVTVAGAVIAVAVPVVVVFRGWWLVAAAGLVLLSALADSADGAVAVITGQTSRLGSFDDSIADRLAEAAWLLALWLVGGHGLVVAACGAVTWLHEYVRSRSAAAGSGGVGVVTVAERPTRVIAVVAALGLGAVAWAVNPELTPGAVTIVLAIWLLLGLLGLVRLTGAVRTALR